MQNIACMSVPLPRRTDLRVPELLSRDRPAKQRAVMPMPETPMYKNYGPQRWKDHIWLARQMLVMQPIAKPKGMKPPADDHFRLGVLATNGCHHPAACNGIDNISQSVPLDSLPAYHMPVHHPPAMASYVWQLFPQQAQPQHYRTACTLGYQIQV